MGAKANHHYVPQFYLRNFAEGKGRKSRVVFFDEQTRKLNHTWVRNVGSERYFNRVEVEGRHPDAVEDALATLEGEMAGPLADVIAAKAFPSDEHFTHVMNLAALLSVRNPRLRSLMEKFHQEIAEKVLGVVVSSKEIWERQTHRMKENGFELSENVTYEQMKRFRDEKRYKIAIDKTHLVGMEFEMVEPVLKTLASRNWCFASAPVGSQYITSDDPVILQWADARRDTHIPVGHGLRGTNIYFPLSSQVMLIGAFEYIPERIDHADEHVTSANTIVARNCRRQIYAKSVDFRLNLRDRSNVSGADLPKYFGKD